MDSVSIGLDIGSSAVRAAEISIKDHRRVLQRYAQVGLPPGAVVDGEIINVPLVTTALRRLWTEGGFSDTKVVLGVSGPRVIVRQAEVPAMNAQDLRSSLKFDAQELIPIPMEDASFDFSVLEEGLEGSGGQPAIRVLIVAAQRELLRTQLATIKGAGLTATVMDATPLALMRATPVVASSGPATGVEVLVSIGADLTTVAVREAGVPRFIRSLAVGGSTLTETISNSMHLELALAERLKRGAVPPGSPQVAQARKAMSVGMRDLAEDVRATVDFFSSQGNGAEVERILVTGGASLTEGLAAAIAGHMPVPVTEIDPFATLTIGDVGLDEAQLRQAAAGAATAVGLALWPVESPLIRLSVLPDEVAAARRARRAVTLAACGVAGVAALLGVVGVGQILDVRASQGQVRSAQTQVAALTGQVSELQASTAVHGEVLGRANLVVQSLQGDIDWVRLLGQLSAVMPANLQLTNFSGGTNAPSAPTASSSTATGVGVLTFSVQGQGGLPAASAWLLALQRDQDLQGTWIQGISVLSNAGQVTFSSTSNMTTVAQSNRAKGVTP